MQVYPSPPTLTEATTTITLLPDDKFNASRKSSGLTDSEIAMSSSAAHSIRQRGVVYVDLSASVL
ncbi:hypothetical protein FA13DRAFT_1730530, partial [Coprinellus micaceus]